MRAFLVCVTVALATAASTVVRGPAVDADSAASDVPSLTQDAATAAADLDASAFDEMVRGARGRPERWQRAPELVVLMSVMQYETDARGGYVATEEPLDARDADALIEDLTSSLALLTGDTFTRFAAVRRERVRPGARTPVLRPGRIVVGRYRGVRDLSQHIGRGGRSARSDGAIVSGFIVLDDAFDRNSGRRRLLRAHELGHALGYNHVASRVSIMNPRIGPDPTEFDRRVASRAFAPAAATSPTARPGAGRRSER